MKKISKSSLNYGDKVVVFKKTKNNSIVSTGIIVGYNKGFLVKLSSGNSIVEDANTKIFKLTKNETKRST